MSLPSDPPPVEALLGRGCGTVFEVFRARAERSPDHAFLLADGRRWTYAEGMREAERFAGWVLGQVGEAGAARVAGYLPNRAEAIWAWLGTMTAGAVYVPLNRAHRGPLLQDMIARSGAELLVTDREGAEQLPDLEPTSVRTLLLAEATGAPGFDGEVGDWRQVLESRPAARPATDPRALAEVMFTSGTTGRSKAVMIPSNYLVRGAGWVSWSLDLREDDVIHGWLPLFHIGGQLDMALAFIIGGGTIALQRTFSRSRFWDQVAACEATCFIGFSNVLEILWALEPRDSDLSTLRAGIVGGIPPELGRDFEERFGVRLHDIYGMTEAEPLALPHPGTKPPVGAAGQASPDFELAILDPSGQRLPAGEEGEIVGRPRVSDVMLAGYEGDAEAYVEASAGLWWHTGDLGRLDAEGNLYFIDRLKHAIRRRGENISSFELERLILGHPAVAECTAVGIPSPLGEEDVKVVVALEPGSSIELRELREWCVEQMASFMVPRYMEVLERLPRGPTGKVKKEELTGVSDSTFDAERDRSKTRA
ncbi:MAG: AMP-binding protein [Solirubrobacterales bacterium]